MKLLPPRATLTEKLLPYTTLFRTDIDRKIGISFAEPDQHVGERGRIDLPVGRGVRRDLPHRRRADGPLVRVGLHDVARVIVDADEIDRLADVLEVFGRPRGPGFAEYLGQFFGIKAFQRRSEEHTSELQSLMRISYAVFCLKKKKQ